MKHETLLRPCSTVLMSLLKQPGAFTIPKDMTLNWYRLYLVEKAVRGLVVSLSGTCQNPLARSNFDR